MKYFQYTQKQEELYTDPSLRLNSIKSSTDLLHYPIFLFLLIFFSQKYFQETVSSSTASLKNVEFQKHKTKT